MRASEAACPDNSLPDAEEAERGARQNGAMAFPFRPLRLVAGLTVLALCAACQSRAIARGDSAFRSGDYVGAWHHYQEAGDPADDAELAARLERTRWFLIEDGLRKLLSNHHEEQALAILPQVAGMAPADRAAVPAALEARARDQLGSRHTSNAEELLEAGEIEGALRELMLALGWNPEDELAANLLAMTTARQERESHVGDELYFEGMDHLRHGDDLRARTSFHHAAMLLGPESRAEQRYAGLTEDLAAAHRAEARVLLDSDLLGPAFFAIRSADRLEPEHPETLQLIERLQSRVSSENDLLAGDLAIRGGRPGLVDEILAELEQWQVPAHQARRRELAERNEHLRLDVDYRYARALELDEQVVRAAETYRSILERGKEFGWADVELRLSGLEQRIARATAAYSAALAAEAAGDAEGYRTRLEETLRAASDYADALHRLLVLRTAEALPPEVPIEAED